MLVLRNWPQSCNKPDFVPIFVYKTGPIQSTGSNIAHKTGPNNLHNSTFYKWQRISYWILLNQNLRIYGLVYEISDNKVEKRVILAQYWPVKQAQSYLQGPCLYTWQSILYYTFLNKNLRIYQTFFEISDVKGQQNRPNQIYRVQLVTYGREYHNACFQINISESMDRFLR